MSKKKGELERSREEIANLTKRIHELELENAQLKSDPQGEGFDEKSL
jgi:hypothetical protein